MLSIVDYVSTHRDRINGVKTSRPVNREDGNILIWFIMLFPLMFAIFGVSVDSTLASYTQANLQSAADTATLVSVSQASKANDNAGGSNRIDTPFVIPRWGWNNFVELYDVNRSNLNTNNASEGNDSPYIICQSTVNTPTNYVSPWGTQDNLRNQILAEDGLTYGHWAATDYPNISTDKATPTVVIPNSGGWAQHIPAPQSPLGARKPGTTAVSGLSNCGWTQLYFQVVNTERSVNVYSVVYEKSHTIFMRMVGIKEFSYVISSSAKATL